MRRDDDFPQSVKEELARRAAYRCSNPKCRRLTTGPQVDPARSVNVGVAAHITAASSRGPRYDKSLMPEQRRSAENGIWLCQTHAKLVDNDATRYPTPLLQEWKRGAEERALAEVEGGAGQDSPVSFHHHLCRPGGEPAPAFMRALAAHNLADPDAPDFGQTKYSKWMTLTDTLRKSRPMRTVGFFLAHMPPPLIREEDRPRFGAWMDVNQRRYDPIRVPHFLPGPIPQRISKGHVWHNGHMTRFPQGSQQYFTYLAAELDDGFVEYGFCAGPVIEPYTDTVDYSRALAGFVCFLHFIRDLADTFGGDPTAMSVGLAMRGTRGTTLRCLAGGAAAEKDGFLWAREMNGTDWSVDAVARRASAELLDHWSFLAPHGSGEPEFRNGKYTGDLYKQLFSGNWC